MQHRYFFEGDVEMIEVEIDANNKVVRAATEADEKDFPHEQPGEEEQNQANEHHYRSKKKA